MLLANSFELYLFLSIGVLAAVLQIGFIVFVLRCYRKSKSGQAIIRTGWGGSKVSFDGLVVIPMLHATESIDITAKRIEIDRAEANPLQFANGLARTKVDFVIRLGQTEEDVATAAQLFGSEKCGDYEFLESHFLPMFSDALETVAVSLQIPTSTTTKTEFREQFMEQVGVGLNGFVLEDVRVYHFRHATIVDETG